MKINKISIILVSVICLLLICVYGTFGMINNEIDDIDNVDYAFVIGKSNGLNVVIPANSAKTIDININNPYDGNLRYLLVYDKVDSEEFNIGKLNTSINDTTGIIEKGSSIIVSIIVNNTGEEDIGININLLTGYVNGGEIEVKEGQTIIDKTIDINDITSANIDESGANSPVLYDGMIPVYYDEENNSWAVADSSNSSSKYLWYDYDSKRWANVVYLKNDSKDKYENVNNGDIIDISDIDMFFVWIPRYKYRVWDINKTLEEDKYTYKAYSNGINISFENKSDSTGDIKCNDGVCTTEGNDYYTHDSFGSSIGFWISKFELSEAENDVSSLPEQIAYGYNNIEDIVKVKDKVSSNIGKDVSLLNEEEWSAVTYLTNSVYGLCNGSKNGCRSIYQNTSKSYITGASGGKDSVISDNGSFNYQGFKLDDDGLYDINSVYNNKYLSSSTPNIYGVYDLVGGYNEIVMNFSNEIEEIDNSLYSVKESGLDILDYKFEEGTENMFVVRGGDSLEVGSNTHSYQVYNINDNVYFNTRIIIK